MKEEDEQRLYFAEANRPRFGWQTGHPYVSGREKMLLSPLISLLEPGKSCRILEIGCGEGANAVNLDSMLRHSAISYVGVDFSVPKTKFAKQEASYGRPAAFLAADAQRLPFASSSFDLVFVKDVLHHLEEECVNSLMAEMFRLLRPGGKCVIIEASARWNPVQLAFSLLVRAERGMFGNTLYGLVALTARHGFRMLRAERMEPSCLFRLLLHYRWGMPGLPAGLLLDLWSALMGWLSPRRAWGYVFVAGEKPGTGESEKGAAP